MGLATQAPGLHRGKLFGITHDPDTGDAQIRVPRAVKISIGKPQGKALHVYLAKNAQGEIRWYLEMGFGKELTHQNFATKEECRKAYFDAKKSAPDRRAPEKLDYFTFMKASSVADGTLEPDFDAIEKHGIKPRAIDIVFTDDAPFTAFYEMYSKSALNCRGDGINAERSIEWAQSADEKKAAAEAKAAGKKTFPIINGCWTRGCPFAKPTTNAKGYEVRQCAPHGRLALQLVSDIRLGSRAQYDTTGIRTVSQLFSSLVELATFTGGGNSEAGYVRGIPLKMTLQPFKTNHNGQPGKAYAVSLEFRAESLAGLQQKLLEFSQNFSAQPKQIAPPARQIAAPLELDCDDVELEDVTVEEVAAMTAEFAVGEFDDLDADPEMQAPPTMETATEDKTAALKETMQAQVAQAPAPQAAQPSTPPRTVRPFSIGAPK